MSTATPTRATLRCPTCNREVAELFGHGAARRCRECHVRAMQDLDRRRNRARQGILAVLDRQDVRRSYLAIVGAAKTLLDADMEHDALDLLRVVLSLVLRLRYNITRGKTNGCPDLETVVKKLRSSCAIGREEFHQYVLLLDRQKSTSIHGEKVNDLLALVRSELTAYLCDNPLYIHRKAADVAAAEDATSERRART